MKKASLIVLLVGGCLEVLFGLLWLISIFISLFRGDPLIYAQPLYGYLGLIFRIIRCFFYLSLGVLATLLLGKKEQPILRLYVFVLGSTSLIMDATLSGLSVMKGDVSFLGQFIPLLFSVVYFIGAWLYFLATKPAAKTPVSPSDPS
jgi:hypothetical protein